MSGMNKLLILGVLVAVLALAQSGRGRNQSGRGGGRNSALTKCRKVNMETEPCDDDCKPGYKKDGITPKCFPKREVFDVDECSHSEEEGYQPHPDCCYVLNEDNPGECDRDGAEANGEVKRGRGNKLSTGKSTTTYGSGGAGRK